MAAPSKTGIELEPFDCEHASAVSGTETLPLSRLLWDLDWSKHLPIFVAQHGIRFEVSNFDKCRKFLVEHFEKIFPDEADSAFRQLDNLDAKARFYRLSDVFEYIHEERTIGVVIGAPTDWSTYYCRTTAILPEYQSRGLGDAWFELLFGVLGTYGVQRIEGDVAPTNSRMLRLLTRNEFQIMGNLLTDRWGAVTRVTRFLSRERGELFQRQFCPGFVPRTCGRRGDNRQ